MPAPFGPASASRSRRRSVNETPSKRGSPENSLRSDEAVSTATTLHSSSRPTGAYGIERLTVVAELVVDRRCAGRAQGALTMLGRPVTDAARLTIDTIRALAMDAVQKANAGHPGTAMALAPVAYLLYAEEMRHDPATPDWPGRDRFILSAGHACVLQYAALHLSGYDVTLEDLQQFRQWGSRTPGHPELGHTAGIETTTGPLGQGFANGVGLAIAQRFLADRWNRPKHAIVDSWIYAICSDGDLMEGVCQEAASIAGQLGLGRLVYVYDDNHITIDGSTTLSFDGEDKGKRFEAQGWHVQHVDDAERPRRASARLRGRPRRDGAPVAHRPPHAYRLPGASMRSTRPRRTGRRSARPRSARRRRSWASTPR